MPDDVRKIYEDALLSFIGNVLEANKLALYAVEKAGYQLRNGRYVKMAEHAMKTRKVVGVEIFTAGTYNGEMYTTADIDKMIQAYQELKGRLDPPLKIGHTSDEFNKALAQKIGVPVEIVTGQRGKGAISTYEENVLKAAARAQKETAVPIITHTEAGTMGPEQADILISEGVDPRRIMIRHICGNTNLQYQVAVLQKGAYIAFDQLGIELFLPDNLRRACLVGLIGIGFVEQIMLSQDYVPQFLGRPVVVSDLVVPLLSNWSHTHIFENVIPNLKKAGITEDQVKTMLVRNPQRLSTGE